MSEIYHSLQDNQSSTGHNLNLLEAVTSKMKEYMFDKQDVDGQQKIAHEIQKNFNNNNKQYKKPVFLVDEMQNTFINMTQSFEYVGDNSTFQKRITSILFIQWIAFSFMVSSMAYFFRSPQFLCRLPLTDIFISCPESIACQFRDTSFMKFPQDDPISITRQYGLYCQKTSYAALCLSMFFLGGFISGYLFGYLSERIGRRPILLFIMILSIVSMMICALAPNYQIFTVSYFMIGFCLFGYETSIYSYIGQISGTFTAKSIRFRTISINMLTMVWAGTPIFLPFLGFFSTWRYAFIFFASLFIITLPFAYKCFLESPRFLLSKKKYDQAKGIFRQISVINRRPPYNFCIIEEIQPQNQTYMTYRYVEQLPQLMVRRLFSQQTRRYNYLDLFKYPSLKKPTLVIMYWWMFRFVMYFGLNLALQSILKSGLFLTLMISGAAVVEVLGSFGVPILTTLLYNNYKLDIMRIALFCISFSCTAMWFVQIDLQCKLSLQKDDEFCTKLIIMIVLVIILKFFNTVFFSGLIVYYSEVFPTPVRSLGCGFTLTFGRLGTILVPFYISYMKEQYTTKNSLCFMAPFGFCAFLLCFIMPYTEKEGMRQKISQEQDLNVFQMIKI